MNARDGFVMDAHADQAARLRSRAPLPGLPVHLRRTRGGAGAQSVGRHRSTCSTSCWRSTASSCGCTTTAAPAVRAPSRSGRSTGGSVRRSCEDLEDGITWLKQQPYVDAVADRAERLELRRLHGGVRADAQHQLVGWHRRRAGDRLARLRHRSTPSGYMKLPTEQRGRLPAHRAALRRRRAARAACCCIHGTMDDNVHMQNTAAVRLRAAASRQAVRGDALSALAPRHHRCAAEHPPAADDVRLRDADVGAPAAMQRADR